MSANPKATPGVIKLDEDKLAQALINRGLLAKEDLDQCPPAASGGNADGYLQKLVDAGLLTAGQSRRVQADLSTLIGQQIPGYQLMGKLGQGAMGTVFRARQISMNRLVAVKILPPRLAAKPDVLERLTREAHIAARLSHNNIVQAIDVGSAGNLHYFVMEYVEGVAIRDELERGKVYQEKEAVDIILQIARAVQHANKRGLIHRDIKPGNILLTPDGTAKLADLGMARMAQDDPMAEREKGLAVGTPYYMSPEQIEGRSDIDVRADIYSLGATFYHMVTGRPPFVGKGIDQVLQAHLDKELTPPDHINASLSAGVGQVIEIMMAKLREDRYPTPDDLISDLECLLHHEPPRLALQYTGGTTLDGLAEGEEEEEEEPEEEEIPEEEEEEEDELDFDKRTTYLFILSGLLGLSVLLNLILIITRR